ncbi:MAG: SPFH domain-containing protein [Candidatus Saccharimonadales bacterium]
MIVTIVDCILLVATLIMIVVAIKIDPKSKPTEKWSDSDARVAALIITLVVFVFFVIAALWSTFNTVSTKNVGVETSFGAISGELKPGIHFLWPWVQVTEMDAAIQTDSYTGGNCLNVRIANQQTACVDVSVRWRIIQKKADYLFQNYRTFDNVRDSLVTRELTAAVNNQLSTYNPLNSISLGTPSTGIGNPSLSTIAKRVTVQMRSEIGDDIEVMNTIIPIISFDAQTQSRINQLQQQIALTRIAEQEILTNQAQARANQALAASVSHNPNVLVSECLGILSTMVKNGAQVPAGFSCWPGSSVAAVIAGSTTSSSGVTSSKS